MKKIIIILLLATVLFSLTSCVNENQEYSYSIKDTLKISAWVLDKNIDENGYWEEDENYVYHGYWTESDGRIIDSNDEDIFVLEQLKLNEVRMMVPMGYMMSNLNIYCEFDGIIEVETDDEYIRLSNVSNSFDGTMEYKNIKWPYELCVNVCPLDDYYSPGVTMIMLGDTKLGGEYYLNINAYKFDIEETQINDSQGLINNRKSSPVVRAKLKLVVIEDKAHPDSEDFFKFSPKGRSRFLTVEIISYEYSDSYKLVDEMIWDE